MATKKATATDERNISTCVEFSTEASKPGALAMAMRSVFKGSLKYGSMMALVTTARGGVRPTPGDPGPDIAVSGMYAVLGDGKTVSVTFDTPLNSFGAQTVSGQMLLSSDFKSGYTTFTVTSKSDYASTTTENVRINAGRG